MFKKKKALQSNEPLDDFDQNDSLYDTTVFTDPGATVSRLAPIQPTFSLDCERVPQRAAATKPWLSTVVQDTWRAVATTEHVASPAGHQSMDGVTSRTMKAKQNQNDQNDQVDQVDSVSNTVHAIKNATKLRKAAPKEAKSSEVSERAQALLNAITVGTVEPEPELRQPEQKPETRENEDNRDAGGGSCKLEPEETSEIQKEKKELAAKKRAEKAKKKGAAKKTGTSNTTKKNTSSKKTAVPAKSTAVNSTNSTGLKSATSVPNSTTSTVPNSTASMTPKSTDSMAPISTPSMAPKSAKSMAPKSTKSTGPVSTTSRSARTSLSMIARSSESTVAGRSSNSTIATKVSIARTTESGPRAKKGREPPGLRADPPGTPVGGYNDDATQAPPREVPCDEKNVRVYRQPKSIVRTDLEDPNEKANPWSVSLMLPPQVPGCTGGVQRAATPPPIRPCDLPRGEDIKKQNGSIFAGFTGEFLSRAIKPFGL